MDQRSRGNLIRFGVAILVLGSAAAWAEAQNAPKLRYGFQTGRQYPYEVKITAEFGDTEETREGVLTYNILSTTDQQVVFKQTGRLATHSKARPRPAGSAPRVGGPRFSRPPFPIGPRIRWTQVRSFRPRGHHHRPARDEDPFAGVNAPALLARRSGDADDRGPARRQQAELGGAKWRLGEGECPVRTAVRPPVQTEYYNLGAGRHGAERLRALGPWA